MTPRELARDAAAVAALGVASMHVHQRDTSGQETLDPATIGAVVAAIRHAAPQMEIGVTTARWVEPDPQRRISVLQRWSQLPRHARPDVAAVNVHERGWGPICDALHWGGIGIELGVWTVGDAVTLKQIGVPPGTVRVLAEVTITDPEVAVIEAVRILKALGPLPVPILLHGEEAAAWPVLDYAQRSNYDQRIGFEDTLKGPDDTWLATGNEELVRFALGQPRPRRQTQRRRGASGLPGDDRPSHRR